MTKSTAVIFILGFSLLFRLEKPVSIRISGYVKKSNNIKNVFMKLQNSFWYLLTLVFNANVKKKKIWCIKNYDAEKSNRKIFISVRDAFFKASPLFFQNNKQIYFCRLAPWSTFRAYSKTTPRLQSTVLNVYAFLSWTIIILISTLICYIWLFFSEAGPSCSGSIYSRRIVYVHIPFHTVQHEGIHHGPICFPFVWS